MLQMTAERMRGRRLLAVFRGGVISNVLNPKVLVFVLALLPPFVHPEYGQVGLQFLILGTVFVVILALFNIPIALSGGAIGRMLAARPAMARFQGRFSGVIFIGLALHVAATGRHA
jgi:threonine/homoserine/homoserine lactone efflux protein